VHVQIESISFFRRATGVQDLAQVRYSRLERASPDAADRATPWIATIRYAYAQPANDPSVRRWNPLGFKVLEFESEPEAPGEPAGHTGPEAKGGVP
jgi:type IV secretion system protein VirB8